MSVSETSFYFHLARQCRSTCQFYSWAGLSMLSLYVILPQNKTSLVPTCTTTSSKCLSVDHTHKHGFKNMYCTFWPSWFVTYMYNYYNYLAFSSLYWAFVCNSHTEKSTCYNYDFVPSFFLNGSVMTSLSLWQLQEHFENGY